MVLTGLKNSRSQSRTWIELRSDAFLHNLTSFRRWIGPTPICPVVKANAYGHGLRQVAELAKIWPIWGLAVAHGEEALKLREAGYNGKILVLSSWMPEDLGRLLKMKIQLVVHDFTTLKKLNQAALKNQLIASAHIKVDVGTTRIGFLPNEVLRLRKMLKRMRGVRIASVWSHLSSSEQPPISITNAQLKLFKKLAQGFGPVSQHIACTSAAIRYPQSHFDMIRLGIGLYGIWPSTYIQRWAHTHTRVRLRPAAAWYTRLLQVKHIRRGTFVGYGQTFRARRAMTIGILPVGYADGLKRSSGNTGWVAVGLRRCHILGRVCMNLTMIDLSQIRRPVSGMQVELIGPHVRPEDHAEWSKTIPYEIMTSLHPEISRIIV